MFLSRGLTLDGMAFKELIVGYKTISINTYNTVVLDLSEGNGGRQTLHRYEANHLWESKISGLLIESCKDYITFSKDGVNIIALGNQDTKNIKDNIGIDKVLHSLDS